MPIELTENLAWMCFGTGDISFADFTEQSGRSYVGFQQVNPGKIGHEKDLDRGEAFTEEWTPGATGPAVVIEFDELASLDALIDGLLEYREIRFGSPAPFRTRNGRGLLPLVELIALAGQEHMGDVGREVDKLLVKWGGELVTDSYGEHEYESTCQSLGIPKEWR